MTIYGKVLEYCKQKHMTISAFEKMCGLGNATVRRWEKDSHSVKLSTIKQISLATGIPVVDWLEDVA